MESFLSWGDRPEADLEFAGLAQASVAGWMRLADDKPAERRKTSTTELDCQDDRPQAQCFWLALEQTTAAILFWVPSSALRNRLTRISDTVRKTLRDFAPLDATSNSKLGYWPKTVLPRL